MNRLLTLTVALVTASVALAGCADGGDDDEGQDGVEGKVDEGQFQLKAGKGAISGLLVDDRFRPIDLEAEPSSEFQAQGFVLLQETGQQVRTSENGEFTFVDLDPGEYTLRATARGHEATPAKVTVEEGLFAELTILARRISSATNLVLTEEYSGFTPCAVAVPGVGLLVFNCLDASAESYRPGPEGLNYTGLADVTYMVVEMKMDNAGPYRLVVREDDGSTGGGQPYGSSSTGGADYTKVIMSTSEVYNEATSSVALDLSKHLAVLAFYEGDVEGAEAPAPVGGTGNAGAQTWSRATFLISIFIGEPDVDLESYGLLAPDGA